MKKAMVYLLVMVLLVSITAPASAAGNVMFGSKSNLNQEAEDASELLEVTVGKLTLAMDKRGGSLRITDAQTNAVYEMPTASDADTAGNAYLANYIPAPFTYETARASGTSLTISPNYFNVKSDQATVVTRDDGFDVMYDLVSREIRLTICYTLTEQALQVSIPWSEIEEYGEKYKLVSLSLMPYFHAGLDTDAGYVFYPDGCGAISCFTSDHPVYSEIFSKPVYGDAAKNMDATIYDNEEEILLPVFGVLKNDASMVAWIDEGDKNASIIFEPSGYRMNINRVYPQMTYRSSYQAGLDNGSMAAKIQDELTPSDFTVTYRFLAKGSGYAQMATAYREHLLANSLLPQSQNVENYLNLELFMGVLIDGALFDEYVAMTTFEEAIDVLQTVSEVSELPIRTTLLGWTNKGYGISPTNLKPGTHLGSGKSFAKLQAWCEQADIRLLLEADLVSAHNEGVRFSQSSITHQYNKISTVTNQSENLFLFSPQYILQQSSAKLAERTLEMEADGVLLLRFGQGLYEDNSRNLGWCSRATAADIRVQCVNQIKQSGLQCVVSGGSLYTLSVADYISDVPLQDSGCFFRTETVPFWQIVTHSYIPYTSAPVNLWFDTNEAMLKLIEYGCMPTFRLTYHPSVNMLEAENVELFSSEYTLYLDDIERIATAWAVDMAVVANAAIVDHRRITDDVYCTTYDNGYSVWVNYSQEDVETAGVCIPAMNYAVTWQY